MSDLEQIISNSIADSQDIPAPVEASETPDTPEVEVAQVELAPEAPVETAETPQDEVIPAESTEVLSPAARAAQAVQPVPQAVQEEFEKKYGVQKESQPGRENRIPYSRVKKIVEKAEAQARKDAETPFTTKVQEQEVKIKDYEERFNRVVQFEHVMMNEKEKFLKMLSQIPGYSDLLAPVFTPKPTQPQTPQQVPVESDDMPQPDQQLSDGSTVYSMEQLKKLNAWNRAQAVKEFRSEVDKVYGPMREEREYEKRVHAAEQTVRGQIQEAYQWPLFRENEDAITQLLQKHKDLGLRDAYHYVVIPQLQAKAETARLDEAALEQKVRAKLLAEMGRVPRSTSAPVHSIGKPVTQTTQPRSIEEIIAGEIEKIR